MSLEINGKITDVLPVQSGTSKAGREWQKQEFVIETDDQFPKKVCFTLFGDKISLLNGFNTGDEVAVAFNLESREFNDRWFHNVNAWRINKLNEGGASTPDYSPEDIPPPPEPGDSSSNDDLPF